MCQSVHHVGVVDLVHQGIAIEGGVLPFSEFVHIAVIVTAPFGLIRMRALSSLLGLLRVGFVDGFLGICVFRAEFCADTEYQLRRPATQMRRIPVHCDLLRLCVVLD